MSESYLVICASTGTVLAAENCYLVPDPPTDYQMEQFEEMSDSEIIAYAKEHGVKLQLPTQPEA